MTVGLASASQKARQLLDKMEIEGHLSEEEGKRIIDELIKSGKSEATDFQGEILQYIQKIYEEIETPSVRQLNELRQRIEVLEQQLKEKS